MPTITSHKVAGVYDSRAQARETLEALRTAGFEDRQLLLADGDGWEAALAGFDELEERTDGVLAKAAAAGAGAGALGAGALAAGISVVAAAPVAAVLAGAGIGALAGGALAGIGSTTLQEGDFRGMVREAAERSHTVAIARARSEAEALQAQDIITRSAAASIDQSGGVARGAEGRPS